MNRSALVSPAVRWAFVVGAVIGAAALSRDATSLGDRTTVVAQVSEVFADVDSDFHADVTYWRPGPGTWYMLKSSTSFADSSAVSWGTADQGDRAVPGDYDGDGKLDPAIWRTTNGHWYALRSSAGYSTYIEVNWGSPRSRRPPDSGRL